MSKINVIGLDLAKNVFQVHGINEDGDVAVRKQLKRIEVLRYFAKLPPCLVGMEACMSAHYWWREISKFGHVVRLMAPAFVKPYVRGNKNDRNDAAGICEAVQRPNMRFVAAKTPEQQAVLHLHHARQLLVQQRVALNNHLRAVLLEYGISLPVGVKILTQALPGLLEDGDNALPMLTRHLLAELKTAHDALNAHIQMIENQLQAWHQSNPMSLRLVQIPVIGLLTATALAATIGDIKAFKNARHLAAFLGLVPKQHSSGGKDKLLGISKRGDGYVRGLLIHGARAVMRHIQRRIKIGQASGNAWVEQCLQRMHVNKVIVALANKMARMAWAVLAHQQDYRAA
jgi:transposase